MSFEQTVLFRANVCGIKHAYFCEGSMFFDKSNATTDAINEFRVVYPNTVVSPVGKEVAVDFVDECYSI